MTRKRKIAIGGAILLVLALVTNPSNKDFKDYTGSNTYRGLRRDKNYFLFSIYEDASDNRYVGAVSNFFEIAVPQSQTSADDATVTIDTSAAASSSNNPLR